MKPSHRSGGPRTEEGKRIISRNALKTGVYSTLTILPGESEADFKELEDQFNRDFSPQNVAESMMVKELALLAWKKMRLNAIEHKVLINLLNEPIQETEADQLRYVWQSEVRKIIDGLALMTDTYLEECQRSIDYLSPLMAQKNETWTEETLLQAVKDYPLILELLTLQIEDYKLASTPKALKGAQRMRNVKDNDSESLVARLPAVMRELEENRWACWHKEEILREVEKVKQDRMLKFMESPSTMRAHADLNQAFYKTLNELRKHQAWRREMGTIDVTP